MIAFDKVSLNPGEKRKLQIVIDPAAPTQPLSYWESDAQAWTIGEGSYQFYLGSSSTNIVESDAITIRTPGR